VDQLSRILIRFASRKPPASVIYDPPTVARVCVAWIDFSKLLTSAFEQIRLYSTSDVAVSLRMLRALGDIAVSTSDQAYRRLLIEAGVRIVEGCAAKLTAEELGPIRARFAALEKCLS
jgi:uncharacterized membrane protein